MPGENWPILAKEVGAVQESVKVLIILISLCMRMDTIILPENFTAILFMLFIHIYTHFMFNLYTIIVLNILDLLVAVQSQEF